MHKCGIYVITNTVNGKRYVGSSTNIKRRWKEHRSRLKHNKHENTHLQAAWNKYGESAFTFKVVAWLEVAELRDTEARLIKAWDLTNPDKGYNFSDDTVAFMRGRKMTPDHKAKIGAANRGRKHTPETKANMSAAQKGIKREPPTPEARANMSAAHIGKVPWNKGYLLTPEHRAKLSAAHIGKVPWNKGTTTKETK